MISYLTNTKLILEPIQWRRASWGEPNQSFTGKISSIRIMNRLYKLVSILGHTCWAGTRVAFGTHLASHFSTTILLPYLFTCIIHLTNNWFSSDSLLLHITPYIERRLYVCISWFSLKPQGFDAVALYWPSTPSLCSYLHASVTKCRDPYLWKCGAQRLGVRMLWFINWDGLSSTSKP